MQLLSEAVANNSLDDSDRNSAKYHMILCKIAMGQFEEALIDLGNREAILTSKPIQDVFNYGMAEWGLTRSVPVDIFARVVELSKQKKDANYAQCLAIASHLTGNSSAAFDWLLVAT
jgi:hypothetical protein